jgi:hypothetical protein
MRGLFTARDALWVLLAIACFCNSLPFSSAAPALVAGACLVGIIFGDK